MNRPGTPATWIWNDFVPSHLEPFENQKYVMFGIETWNEWPYVLLDWKDDAGNVICRYACWVAQVWGASGWRGHTLPSLPGSGWILNVLEVKARRRKRDFLFRCEWAPNDQWTLLFFMTMHGCYVVPP